jgi:hypothetical protein
MRAVFADTSYYLALLVDDDDLNGKAAEVTRGLKAKVVTTEWILAEVVDALSYPPYRERSVEFAMYLEMDADVTVLQADHASFVSGLRLFSQRPDKTWSLTDCISFVVMQEHGLADALTADRHFQQAGFRALLLETDPSE